jgi:hypothetical protein
VLRKPLVAAFTERLQCSRQPLECTLPKCGSAEYRLGQHHVTANNTDWLNDRMYVSNVLCCGCWPGSESGVSVCRCTHLLGCQAAAVTNT